MRTSYGLGAAIVGAVAFSSLSQFMKIPMGTVLVAPALAAPTNAALTGKAAAEEKSKQFEEQIELQNYLLEDIDRRAAAYKAEIKEKTLLFYKLKKRPARGPMYLWMSEDKGRQSQQQKGLKLLELALKEKIRELDLLETRRVEAQAELEWIHIQQEEFQKNLQSDGTFLASQTTPNFECELLPLIREGSVDLLQGFGLQRDPETDLEWNSLGWWFAAEQAEARACAPATVAFVGEISGRGRVVMLDHGGGHLTVYANLNPELRNTLKKGARVRAGQVLGSSLDRLYFEYRRAGIATHPKMVLTASALKHVEGH